MHHCGKAALQIARDLFERGHFIEARRALEGDESAEALLLAGQCHQRVGEVQQALRLYKQAADISLGLPALGSQWQRFAPRTSQWKRRR